MSGQNSRKWGEASDHWVVVGYTGGLANAGDDGEDANGAFVVGSTADIAPSMSVVSFFGESPGLDSTCLRGTGGGELVQRRQHIRKDESRAGTHTDGESETCLDVDTDSH